MKHIGCRIELAVALCAALVAVSVRAEEPKVPPEHVKKLQGLGDRLKQALDRGDLDAAERLNRDLGSGLLQARRMVELPPREQLAKLEQAAPVGPARRYELSRLALAAFDAAEYARAERYAREMLDVPQPDGRSVFYGNLVLGRIALSRDKDVAAAKRALIASGQTPGSPTLNSFGPNMTLARDLLVQGEREAVLQFFDMCRKFWRSDSSKRLDEWTALVKGGAVPDFRANLLYVY